VPKAARPFGTIILAIRTKWASPLQLPYPSLMRGLDTLLRRVRSHSDIFYSHECA